MLRVNVNTIVSWEVGRAKPKLSYLPGIIVFLGYDPVPRGETLGERLRREWERRGLTQERCARHLGIATCTLQKLEAGEEAKDERVREVRGFVEQTEGV
jgi:DNA-binding XRE family transcriptional regulator